MLGVRMNDAAVEAIGLAELRDAVPAVELAPQLRTWVAEGVAQRGEALVFARHVEQAGPAPRGWAALPGDGALRRLAQARQ